MRIITLMGSMTGLIGARWCRCWMKERMKITERERKMGLEWKVSSQYIGGSKMYIAMRILDPAQPQHGGNVETRGIYTEDKDMVQELVDRLNEPMEEYKE